MKAKKVIVFSLLATLLVSTMACGGGGEPAATPTPMPTPTIVFTPVYSLPTSSGESPAVSVFLSFLHAWEREDWSLMADLTQLTWRKGLEDPAAHIFGGFAARELLGAEIVEVQVASDACEKITADVYYAVSDELWAQRIMAMVICEVAPYEPSPMGHWGVNPGSVLGGWGRTKIETQEESEE